MKKLVVNEFKACVIPTTQEEKKLVAILKDNYMDATGFNPPDKPVFRALAALMGFTHLTAVDGCLCDSAGYPLPWPSNAEIMALALVQSHQYRRYNDMRRLGGLHLPNAKKIWRASTSHVRVN